MALSFNSATKKWERSPTTAPVASSIPTAPAPVKAPTPVTYTQQTDPAKAKISSIGTQTSGTPSITQTNPNKVIDSQPGYREYITKVQADAKQQAENPLSPKTSPLQPGQQEAYDFIGAPKTPTTPTQPTGTTQPTTPELGAPAQDEWIGQSKSEEQALQDNIDKTQEELMNLRNREDALGQAEYLKKTKELQEYQAKQKEITDKQKAMSEEQAQIQSSAKLREAQRSLSQLKRNTAYLSSQGLGQSAGALDAFSEQISNAEQTFKEMKQYEQYVEEMRKLGYDFDANAYEQSMKEQQDELDKYVSDTIQTIFNNMSAAEMAGQMDTVDEVDAFAAKYFNAIDTDIANMTRKQIQIAEQKLVLQTQTLERAREFVKNKGIVNQEMSAAQGYYVDGNGQPLISATTGGIIPTPVDPPKDPIFDEKTGQLISFSLDENGKIIADVQQVIDMPTFGASTISNMAKAVANGTMTVAQALDVLPPASQQAFLDQIGDIQPAGQEKDIKTVTFPDGTKQSGVFDPVTGEFTPIQPAGFTPNGTPVSQAIKTAIEKNKTGAQCGKFVNDILQNMGLPRLVKDSYQSKEMAISQIGIATSYDDMGAGSIFAYPVKGSNYGHIGIVTGVNDDGTIDIMDYNYKGDEQRRERQNVDPAEIINMGGRISKPIIRDDTVAESTTYDPKVQKMAESIIKGIGDYPSKNDKNYTNVVSAVNDLLEQKKASTDDYQLQSIYDSSKYEKTVSDTGIKQIQDIKTVIGGVENLTKQLSKEDTGPIVGYLRNKNPWDVDAGAITAQINQLAPKVARGVFGEVGVLTDSDIERYLKTIPNLKQTKDLGSVVGDLLQIAVYKSFINTVVTNAQGGRNMSNFVTDYEKAKQWLEKKGVSSVPFDNSQPTQTAPAKATVHPSLFGQAR